MTLGTIHAWLSGGDHRKAMTELVRAGGREIVFLSDAELDAHIGEIEVLLFGIAPRLDWARAERLRFIQVFGSGTDSLWPVTGLPERVQIANARGVHLPEMADYALAAILRFEQDATTLRGKTVAILGLGTVGRAVAESCTSLGMRVVSARASEPYDLHGLMGEADYVVVLLPLTPRTSDMIDARAIATLKPGALLIAMSRGGIVDEAALAAALRSGRLRGAVLDVLAKEPLDPASELRTVPNLVLTPHIAGVVPNYIDRLVALALDNIARLERGAAPKTLVDRERGY